MDTTSELVASLTVEEKLDKCLALLEGFDAKISRFEPLLARYEQAMKANGMLAQRRAMRGKG